MTRGPRRAAGLLGVVALVGACSVPEAARPPPPSPPDKAAIFGPARYLVASPHLVEKGPSDIERVLCAGQRFETRGPEIASTTVDDFPLDGAVARPAWLAGKQPPYLFWQGERLLAADGFLAPVRPFARLSQPPRESFDWFTGTGFVLSGGVAALTARGILGSIGVPCAVRALAIDARRAVVQTALGHARLTLDGGATYRDVSEEIGGANNLEVRGDAIVASIPDQGERAVGPTGAIVAAGPGLAANASSPDPDGFFQATHTSPLDAAMRAGMALDDGGVIVVEGGFVGRMDARTLKTTSIAPLEPALRDATCEPVRVGREVLLACVGPQRAALVDVGSAPRSERTFDLAGASDLDRFVVNGDDALGFLGACDGSPPRVPDVEITNAAEAYIPSPERSPVFCVRASRDEWIEHRVPPEDAMDLVAWVPRPGGAAIALLARATPVDAHDRVNQRGLLRVVRFVRGEAPLASGLAFDQRDVERSLRAGADDSIAGWAVSTTGLGAFSSGALGAGLSFVIDATGHIRTFAPPLHATQVEHAGAVGLASSDDGRVWETVDAGRRWIETEPPPGRPGAMHALGSCSAVGCLFSNGLARLGWGGADKVHDDGADRAPPTPPPSRPSAPPLLQLVCAAAAPPEGRRGDEAGLGFSVPAHMRDALAPIGNLGFAQLPATSSIPGFAPEVAHLAWLPPFATNGVLERRRVSLAQLGFNGDERPDLSVSYMLARTGKVETFASGRRRPCGAPLLEAAGLARPIGGCAEGPVVGVDLGAEVVVVHRTYGAIDVLTAEGSPSAPRSVAVAVVPSPLGRQKLARGKAPPRVSAPAVDRSGGRPLHLVHTTSIGASLYGFELGAGERAGVPVVVVLDVNGDASIAPLSVDKGTIGTEDQLISLGSAALGSSPACTSPAGRDDGEARVLLPFEGAIALQQGTIPGLIPWKGAGVALLRWSKKRACIDAIELPVRDDRFDESPARDREGASLHRLVARFDHASQAMLLFFGLGSEVRQRLSCTGLTR